MPTKLYLGTYEQGLYVEQTGRWYNLYVNNELVEKNGNRENITHAFFVILRKRRGH